MGLRVPMTCHLHASESGPIKYAPTQGIGDGCAPCTSPCTGEDERSGRWSGQSKTECGLHFLTKK